MYKKIENWFGNFGSFIANNPFKVIVFTILLVIFPISQLPKLTMDISIEALMHKGDPKLKDYEAFKEQFGRDERIIIGIKSDDIFSLSFLENLQKMHLELENTLPFVDEVTSLSNVRNTRGEGDKLFVDDLLEKLPKNQEELLNIKNIVMNSEFYRNLFISKDGEYTAIMIEAQAYISKDIQNIDEMFSEFNNSKINNSKKIPLTPKQNSQIVKKTFEIIEKYQADNFDIYCSGYLSVMDSLKFMMRKDMQKFNKLTVLIILVFLFIIFRRITATIYPLIVIILSLLVTLGSMAFFEISFKQQTQIVPSLLLAVSIGATVHILSVFFGKFNKIRDKKEALIYTMKHSGLAITMTGITTAIGMASFMGSEVAPMAEMGVFASLGVIVSLILTLMLLPALLMISKIKPKSNIKNSWLDYFMKKFAYIPSNFPKIIIVSTLLLLIVSLYLSTKLILSHHPLEWFPKDNQSYIATKLMDKELGGTLNMEIIIDSKELNGWQSPQRLQKLDDITSQLEGYSDGKVTIGKIFSLNTIIKESNRALHANDQAYYTIPKDKALLSQELLLFENSGSDDLEDIVDSQFSKLRITHKLNWKDSLETNSMINHIESKYKKVFKDEEVVVTGVIPLLSHIYDQAMHASVKSYGIAFIMISIIMMLIMGSVKLGLISMIPNLTPIILGLLIMYIFKIPLDMFTFLVAPIILGIVVDDTIHFFHNFRRYYLQSFDVIKAMENTFFTTGKALVITTILLSLGFYSFIFGSISSIQNFGFLTGSIIILALFADLLLAPALMIIAAKRGWIK